METNGENKVTIDAIASNKTTDVTSLLDGIDLSTPKKDEQINNISKEDLEKAEQLKIVEQNKAIEEAKLLEQNKIKEVEIDGKLHKVNEKGEAVNENGEVVLTKEKIDELAKIQENEDKPLVLELVEKIGIKPLNADGTPKQYEDSVEGLIQLSNDIAEEKAYKQVETFFKQRPEVEKYAEYLDRGGKPEDFFKAKSESWLNVKFDEKNDSLLKNAIYTDLIKSGFEHEQAEMTVQLYEDTKKLKEFGKTAFEKLINNEKHQEELEKSNWKKRQEDLEINTKQHWDNINNVILKGQLANISIPENDRKAFFEYVALTADEQGNSKASLDRQKASTEQLLQLDYLLYKGFDLSKLIENAVKTEKTKQLRLRINQQIGASGGEGIDKTKYTNPNSVNISLDKIV